MFFFMSVTTSKNFKSQKNISIPLALLKNTDDVCISSMWNVNSIGLIKDIIGYSCQIFLRNIAGVRQRLSQPDVKWQMYQTKENMAMGEFLL